MNFRLNTYSEEEIREYIKEYLGQLNGYFWFDISRYQTLSEDFIRDFQDEVCWKYISVYQTLSEEFLIEFIEDIVIGNDYTWGLVDNVDVPEDVKQRIYNLKKVIDQ